MRKVLMGVLLATVAISVIAMAGDAKSEHVIVYPKEIKWGPPPPVFEQNAKFTVLSGDPSQPGLYAVRIKMPAGYKIMPHWHPTDEHVTVLTGEFAVGMGEKWDKSAMKVLPPGGYVLLPAEMRHYAGAITDATIQVDGAGPFQLTYVNPADDPSKRAPAKH
jgi:quercetin dioxygenase-like cupin family protein